MEQNTLPRSRFGLSANMLKYLMAFLMLLDHIYIFLPGHTIWFDYVSRVVAPVFCFLMTQSLLHTRNRQKYITRMYVAGAVMLVGNLVLSLVFSQALGNSILLALAASAHMMACMDKAREKTAFFSRLLWSGASVLLFFFALIWEGFILIPATALVFYYLHGRKVWMCATYVGVSLAITLPGLFGPHQWMMVFAVIPILLYNGSRGSVSAFNRCFFYVFYPLHIWVLFVWGQLL